jgi:hypothetical protein
VTTDWEVARLSRAPVPESGDEIRAMQQFVAAAVKQGRIFSLPSETRCIVIQRREKVVRVLITEGERRNWLVWVEPDRLAPAPWQWSWLPARGPRGRP